MNKVSWLSWIDPSEYGAISALPPSHYIYIFFHQPVGVVFLRYPYILPRLQSWSFSTTSKLEGSVETLGHAGTPLAHDVIRLIC